MNELQDRLNAFVDGSLSMDELDVAIAETHYSPADIAEAVESLKASFRQGALSDASYEHIRNRLLANAPGTGDEATRISRPGDGSHDPASDPTVTVASSPQPANPGYEKTEIIPAEELPVPEDPARGAASAPSSQAATSPTGGSSLPSLDFELPSEVSAGTGSNWSRPEEWKPTELGPIDVGTLIKNRFLIEAPLGRGGMGVVFKARDLRKEEAHDSDPFVAIKILSDEFRNHPAALISLQREAVKAQKLAHPNVITVYDFDRDGTTVYMTMELMRGESLSDRIRTSGWSGTSAKEAVPMIEQMAAGLAYAHEHDIVHSDFKPANVFLTSKNRIKVLDFGIARAAKRSAVDRGDETVFDAGDLSALTPRYASYEMLTGQEPHASDDVYGLAVTAYQLLTGEHPFDLRTAEEAMARDMVPQPIKGLKRRQWKAIRRGLQFRRDDRQEHAAAFLAQFQGPSKAQKTAYAAIAALILVAAFFGYQSTLEKAGPFPEERRAEFEQLLASGEEAFDVAVEEEEPLLLGTAAESFAAAWDIHPRNPKVSNWLESIADESFDMVPEESHETVVANLVCKGHLASYRPVTRACNELGAERCQALLNRCEQID